MNNPPCYVCGYNICLCDKDASFVCSQLYGQSKGPCKYVNTNGKDGIHWLRNIIYQMIKENYIEPRRMASICYIRCANNNIALRTYLYYSILCKGCSNLSRDVLSKDNRLY
jgi:hypothetical protein